MEKGAQVKLEDLKTPQAKALYKFLELMAKWLKTADDPMVEQVVIPQINGAKALCLEVDKEPENQQKVIEFIGELQKITKEYQKLMKECQKP